MRERFRIVIDSTAIGRRYVGRSHTKARQHYTTTVTDALVFGDDLDGVGLRAAKDFCKTSTERDGCRYLVERESDGRVIYSIGGGRK